LTALAVFSMASTAPFIATAQVLEIDGAGTVTIHDRPEVTLSTGSIAIVPPAQHQQGKSSRPPPDRADLTDAADHAEISAELVEAVAWRESGLKPGRTSPVGAIGEMQLMPGTARELGVNPYDSSQNLRGGATYLALLLKRYDGDMIRALAAYNAGPKAVDKYGGVPPYKETQAYVAAILDRLSQGAAAAPGR